MGAALLSSTTPHFFRESNPNGQKQQCEQEHRYNAGANPLGSIIINQSAEAGDTRKHATTDKDGHQKSQDCPSDATKRPESNSFASLFRSRCSMKHSRRVTCHNRTRKQSLTYREQAANNGILPLGTCPALPQSTQKNGYERGQKATIQHTFPWHMKITSSCL